MLCTGVSWCVADGRMLLIYRQWLVGLIPASDHLLQSGAQRGAPTGTRERSTREGREQVELHKLLVDLEEVPEVLFRDAEAQQHTDGHAEGELLCLLVHIDGLRVAAPGTQCVLDHQLDLGQVALQGLVAKDLGEDLEGRRVSWSHGLKPAHIAPTWPG